MTFETNLFLHVLQDEKIGTIQQIECCILC